MKTLLLKVAVSAALIAILLTRVDLGDLSRPFASVGWLPLAIASLCIFGLSVVTAARWKAVLKVFGHPLPFADLWRYTLIGMFFNQLLPSGVGGDGLRMWYARRAGVSLGFAIGTVLVDRILGLLGLLLVVLIGLPYVFSLGISGTLAAVMAISAAVLVLGISAFLLADYILAGLGASLKGGSPGALAQRPAIGRFREGLARTAKDTRRLLKAFPYGPATLLFSVLNQVALGLVVLYLARSMSIDMPAPAALFLFPVVVLLSTIPISLAGWGLREGAMVVVFSIVGLRPEASLGISVLFGACMFLAGLPGGAMWLIARRAGGPVA